ncbi:MAG: site-2 protease family protein [Bdellovibrionales bacterium]|nr:site-2 protease family protein [Bdellovibrionales bacterium]
MDINTDNILRLAVAFPPFLFALCFHEYAHGWTARLFGDKTAEYMGRLTFNPMAHADPFGTFLLPIVGMLTGSAIFGWAKPVPVNPRNLSHPKTQMFWIAFAGPLSNVLLGLVGAFIYILIGYFWQGSTASTMFYNMMQYFVILNAMLAVFNMIPIHPLDGGKVLARFLPDSVNDKLEEFQNYNFIILFALLFFEDFSLLMIPIQGLANLFITIAHSVIGLFV